METLRLRSASPIGRTAVSEGGVHLSASGESGLKWRLDKDVDIVTTSWLGGHDEPFWSGNENGTEHSAHVFWAERFLQYPDSANNGSSTDGERRVRTAEDDEHAKLVTADFQGLWFPYGGGSNMCPGRFFAKKQIMASIAILLRAFDFEFADPVAASKVNPDMKYFLFGVMPPDAPIPVRVRRRYVG